MTLGALQFPKGGVANIFIRSISDDRHVNYNTGLDSANI